MEISTRMTWRDVLLPLDNFSVPACHEITVVELLVNTCVWTRGGRATFMHGREREML